MKALLLGTLLWFSNPAVAITCQQCGSMRLKSEPGRVTIADAYWVLNDDYSTEAQVIFAQLRIPNLPPTTVWPPPQQPPRQPPQSRGACAGQGAPAQFCGAFNQWRAGKGLQPLILDPRLNQVAQAYAEKLFADGQRRGDPLYLEHNDEFGGAADRVSRAGIAWREVGENLAAGDLDINSAIDGWANSPGHYANMINPQFTRHGFGYFNGKWVHVFLAD